MHTEQSNPHSMIDEYISGKSRQNIRHYALLPLTMMHI